MLNITQQMNQQEILQLVHSSYIIPSLWLLYVIFAFVFLISGLILIDKSKSGYGKFFLIWILSILIVGIFTVFLTLSPNSLQAIINLFKTLIN